MKTLTVLFMLLAYSVSAQTYKIDIRQDWKDNVKIKSSKVDALIEITPTYILKTENGETLRYEIYNSKPNPIKKHSIIYNCTLGDKIFLIIEFKEWYITFDEITPDYEIISSALYLIEI